jgi:UDP-N-acetylmuramyl pentapeptide synthase
MLTLADALEALTNFRPIATTVITEAVIDSRQVIPGSLFVAIPGEKLDGHDFIEEAFRRGASFALIQRDMNVSFRTLDMRSILSVDSFLVKILCHLCACAWRTQSRLCSRSRATGAVS